MPLNSRYFFKSLGRRSQLEFLQVHGRLMKRRVRGTYSIQLYRVNNFYIEVWYNTMKNRIDDYITFKDGLLLGLKSA